MKNIKNIEFLFYGDKNRFLEIVFKKKYLRVHYTGNEAVNRGNICLGNTKKFDVWKDFISYIEYSKDEMLEMQYTLLQAYVYSYDKLEEAVETDQSQRLMMDLKEKVIAIRKHLRYVTKYIDGYPEMKKDFIDV